MAEMSTDTDGMSSPSKLSAHRDGDTDVHDSEEDLKEVTEELAQAPHTDGTEQTVEDANPEESVQPHHGEEGLAETPGLHLTSASPGEPSGADTAEPTEGELNECSCSAEPDTQNTRTGESEGRLDTEEKVTEKEEGEARLMMGPTGGEEKTAEDESGDTTLVGKEEGSPSAMPETADAPPGPAPEEAQSSEAENLHEQNVAPSESPPEDRPSSPAAAEGGSEAGVTQTDSDAPESAGSVEPSEASEGSVETEKPPTPEKKKPVEKKRDIGRSRTVPKSHGGQSRKAIMEKFGGPATGTSPGIKVQRSTSFGASSVKNMLLEWCKAKTRDYEHVDIQNFSSSWSSGMAFCALVHKFFPDEFDYATLDPKNHRQNFELAFSTAEKCADCSQLLEVDDMVRMRVPDSKCVYTYVQELYRSLVQMGLVKTKKQ